MNMFWYKLSSVLLCISIFMLGVFAFWAFYPYKTLELKDDVFPILNKDKTIKQGGTLQFVSDNCKYVDLPATTSRAFVNSIIYYVPTTTTNIRKGCGKVTINVSVSRELPPGKYYLHNIFQYKVNPVRIMTVEHNTEPFFVIE
jgi:hypothetical protein